MASAMHCLTHCEPTVSEVQQLQPAAILLAAAALEGSSEVLQARQLVRTCAHSRYFAADSLKPCLPGPLQCTCSSAAAKKQERGGLQVKLAAARAAYYES